MGRADESGLSQAKWAYQNAKSERNHTEEARWANVIGDILKNRGEYMEALKWLRIDYDVSIKYLPQKQLLATCQSLGEVYLRLERFQDALVYQKKHLDIAKESNDMVEQQRATTQLGRTYHEMFLRSDDDTYSVHNAKKYFKSAMNLAKKLKENPPSGCTSFIKEYIDAYNNIGMLEIDLDNLNDAKNILTEGLQICQEEEVDEDDDGRTRLHHNLGKVYLELRKWDDAREHIEKDIMICRKIGHCQGEAKGYINLGELHYRKQMCDEAICCYKKALKLAKSMEDEDVLVDQICQNIETVKEAKKVLDELKQEDQNRKKLIRNMPKVRGTARERKCLLLQNACLDRLIEKSRLISAWSKHLHYAKEKKQVATELCDKEKLSDSFLVLGESYTKLREFDKALEWYTKSLEMFMSIGNLEGQALAKINIGDVKDSDGDWEGAFEAFEDGYRIALEANLPSTQLSALENMHYSHMIRFDNIEEARALKCRIDELKKSMSRENEAHHIKHYSCSETDTEGDEQQTNGSGGNCSNNTISSDIEKEHSQTQVEVNVDTPIILLKNAKIYASKSKPHPSPLISGRQTQVLPKNRPKPVGSQQTLGSRKRYRVILSDDEEGDEHEEVRSSERRHHEASGEHVATSDELMYRENIDGHASKLQDVSVVASKSATPTCSPIYLEESSSYMSRNSVVGIQGAKNLPTSRTGEDVSRCLSLDCSGLCKHASTGDCGLVLFRIDEKFVHADLGSCMVGGTLSLESIKVEVACLYYLQLPAEKRSQGILPIIQHMKYSEKGLSILEEGDNNKGDLCGKGWIDVSIGGWTQKRLMKLYIDCCNELSVSPNLKLLKKLYNLEVSEDEVVVSDCELLDVSIKPLLNALEIHKTIALLDLSHNSLGNETVEQLQKVLSSGQRYGGLVLDLHQNVLGPSSLFQFCECPVLFSRLEVLNVSGNRLTDASGYCLTSILENCKALYSLSVERCSITSRTIQKIADALHSDSVLAHIAIGYNSPVSASTISNLLKKLATLKRFSELNLSGLKLGKPVVNSLCELTITSCFQTLMLGDTTIGTEGALQLTRSFNANQELVKLDLSSCGLTSQYVVNLNVEISLISSLVELNLGGNPIMQEGGNAIVSVLKNPQCCLKVLVLSKCQLGVLGVVRILQALSENCSVEELDLAKNVNRDAYDTPPGDTSSKNPIPEEAVAAEQESLAAKLDCDKLEVADSEDDQMNIEHTVSGRSDDCVSSSHRYISSQESSLVQELSTAIGVAEHLKFLDLSDNRLSKEIVEELYAAWSSCSRANIARRHINEMLIHFSIQGHKCCGLKPCCRKD